MTNTADASMDPWISMCFHRSGVIPPTLGYTGPKCMQEERQDVMFTPLHLPSNGAQSFDRTNHLQFGPVIFPGKILVACEIR